MDNTGKEESRWHGSPRSCFVGVMMAAMLCMPQVSTVAYAADANAASDASPAIEVVEQESTETPCAEKTLVQEEFAPAEETKAEAETDGAAEQKTEAVPTERSSAEPQANAASQTELSAAAEVAPTASQTTLADGVYEVPISVKGVFGWGGTLMETSAGFGVDTCFADKARVTVTGGAMSVELLTQKGAQTDVTALRYSATYDVNGNEYQAAVASETMRDASHPESLSLSLPGGTDCVYAMIDHDKFSGTPVALHLDLASATRVSSPDPTPDPKPVDPDADVVTYSVPYVFSNAFDASKTTMANKAVSGPMTVTYDKAKGTYTYTLNVQPFAVLNKTGHILDIWNIPGTVPGSVELKDLPADFDYKSASQKAQVLATDEAGNPTQFQFTHDAINEDHFYVYVNTDALGGYNDRVMVVPDWANAEEVETGGDVVEEQVVAPQIIASETEQGMQISLACETEGAELYYTTDLTLEEFSAETWTKYEGAFDLSESATVRAIALKNGVESSVVSEDITIEQKVVDPAEMETGTYSVPYVIKNAFNPSQYSMANGAVNGPMTIAYNKEKGVYTCTINVGPIELTGITGHLLNLWNIPSTDRPTGSPSDYMIDSQKAEIIAYEDQAGIGGAIGSYGTQFKFTRGAMGVNDSGEAYFYVHVDVDAMAGFSQNAMIVPDWSKAEKISDEAGDTEGKEEEPSSPDDPAKDDPSKDDPAAIEVGTYTTDVQLWHAQANQPSMGNVAFAEVEDMVIVQEDGSCVLKVATKPVFVAGFMTAITEIQSADGLLVTVESTGNFTTNSKFDGEEHDLVYAKVFSLRLDELDPDQNGNIYVNMKMKVPYTPMEAVGASTDGWLDCRLKFNVNELAKAASDQPLDPSEELGVSYPEQTLRDSATGIMAYAAKGYLPEGAKMVVESVTSGAAYNAALASVGEAKFYRISFTDANGASIEPQGNIVLTLPGANADSVLYRVSDAGETSVVSGQLAGGSYSASTSSMGLFALGARSDDSGASNGSSNGTSNGSSQGSQTSSTQQQASSRTNASTNPLASFLGANLGRSDDSFFSSDDEFYLDEGEGGELIEEETTPLASGQESADLSAEQSSNSLWSNILQIIGAVLALGLIGFVIAAVRRSRREDI